MGAWRHFKIIIIISKLKETIIAQKKERIEVIRIAVCEEERNHVKAD